MEELLDELVSEVLLCLTFLEEYEDTSVIRETEKDVGFSKNTSGCVSVKMNVRSRCFMFLFLFVGI